jgi:hypothetical protein
MILWQTQELFIAINVKRQCELISSMGLTMLKNIQKVN